MSNRIHELIDNVREKATSFHNLYLTERSNNQSLNDELSELKSQLSEKDELIAELQSKIENMSKVQETTTVQSVDEKSESLISDDHIDELVKEIEYCIGQLKK